MTSKTCTKCGVVKPLDEYGKDKAGKHGRGSRCKTCLAEYHRRYREENQEWERERQRRYREANREQVRERKRRWWEENQEWERERQRRYREANREQVREQYRRYEEENRELSEAMSSVPPRTSYTPEEDALVMADNGMTVFQKAIELGRTYKSVRNRREYLRRLRSAA